LSAQVDLNEKTGGLAMIRRITIQNYMSHSDTVIEPAAGLTVLVGPNNCGKSAVVSALETLCNNASGDYMVRHDEKEARITVETDDGDGGHTFVWRRRGKVVSYIVDGREIHRVGRTIPEKLHEFLRLPKVDAGENGDPFDIHFGTQKSPIFLLNEPESRAAVFFASSSDAAILLEMQKRHRNKVKERKNDEKRLRGEIGKLDAELDALEPLKTLATSMALAEGQYQELKKLEDEIQTLAAELEALNRSFVNHQRLTREYECTAPLKPLPYLADTPSIQGLIESLLDAERAVRRGRARQLALCDLGCPPELEDASALSQAVCALANAEENFTRWSIRRTAVKELKTPPELDDVERLESVYRALALEVESHCILEAKATCLNPLREVPGIAEMGPLQTTLLNLESAQLANAAFSRQQRALQYLTPQPDLADSRPLVDLLSLLEGTLKDVDQITGLITATTADMAKLELHVGVADLAGADAWLPGSVERRQGRRKVMAIGFCAVLAALILLFIFGPTWFGRRKTGSSIGADKPVDPPLPLVARVDDNGKTRSLLASGQAADRETPMAQAKREEANKERAKEAEAKKEERKKADAKPEEPKEAEAKELKQHRLSRVRQLLNDADMAHEKGKYLDALLGFGQAAILYPQELAVVQSPEKVRLQFIDALKRYQADVERALREAGEKKTGEK
jgi:exonuclease SbcC